MADQHSLPVRAAYFLLVGWWLTLFAIEVAWLLNVTVVGIPIGVTIINRVPYLLTLRRRDADVRSDGTAQAGFLKRAVYFVLVGWWASLVWAHVAWAFCVTVIGIPIGVWMFDRLPYVTSLHRLDA
ncbi:YccF domain-containing protein [Halorubellus sp. JP-L1]|uniref:YccF domain-containing protein n=1 Tax=Halorubellus sp. JP-L1 TaxID=2715753 RepID=UPI0014086166|nr:YccF domain-containing protein [Halorubellus sp. JP-L1]NHN41753.1 YccF domain-containing protein [Halorubellus sp. JP-L1]